MKGHLIVPPLIAGYLVTVCCELQTLVTGTIVSANLQVALTGLTTVCISLITPDYLEA